MLSSSSSIASFSIFFAIITYVHGRGEQSPLLRCPDGFVQSGKACLNIQYADVMLHCPKGSKLEGDVCLSKKSVLANKQCPKGYVETRERKCEKEIRISAVTQCEKDYFFSKGTCSQTKRTEPELQCPPGYRLDGFTCNRVVKSQARISCPPGTTLIKEKSVCERVEYMEPMLECPKAFVLTNNGVCVQEDLRPMTRECEKGFSMEGDTCVRRIDVGEKVIVCPTGTPKGSKCMVLDIQPGTLACRKGYELEHGRCIQRLSEDPMIVCDDDQKLTPSGECEIKREVPGSFRCPPGSKLQYRKCVAIETKPLLEYCPDGYESIHGDKCVQRIEDFPQIECPRHYKLKEDICYSTVEMSPEPSCPPSTLFLNNMCEGVEMGKAKHICKRGVLENGFCVDNLIKPARLSCPEGYHRDEKSCVDHSYLKPDSFCETGTKSLSQGICHRVVAKMPKN